MKRLRILPVLLAACAAGVVLFGGWFGYQSLALKAPLSKHIDALPGVTGTKIDMSNAQVNVSLNIADDANLREIVQDVEKESASQIGSRNLQISVDNKPSPELEDWWSKVLFDVAQAMETKAYGDIPKALQAHQPNLPGVKAVAEMDDNNVYIQLKLGKERKDIILPRQSQKMGVSSNA